MRHQNSLESSIVGQGLFVLFNLLRSRVGICTPSGLGVNVAMGSLPTILVIATTSLSVTVLGLMLYNAFGWAALRAIAPFVGTVALVFLAAHCLDKAHEAEDAKAARGGKGTKPLAGGLHASGAGGADPDAVRKASSTTNLPKRRRVAD